MKFLKLPCREKISFIFYFSFFILIFLPLIASAIEYPFGNMSANPTPCEYISVIFVWGLGIVGAVAVAAIAYGGFRYMVGQVQEGKEIIYSALLGLLLLMASWLILYTINPELAQLKCPPLQAPDSTAPTTPGVTTPSTPTAYVPPAPSGPLGSKTNPIKTSKPSLGQNVYIPENSVPDSHGIAQLTIPTGSKVYFEVDPAAIAGRSVSVFSVNAKFYEGAGGVCRITQDKTTGVYSSEVCFGSDGLFEIYYDGQPSAYYPYDGKSYKIDNTKFIYSFVGSPDGELHEAIWITIPQGTTM